MESFERERKKEKSVYWKELAKYFFHGIAFSLLFTILAFLWAFGLIVLTMIGSFIGLILGLVILMLIVGAVNCGLTSLLWFRVRTGLRELLFHGLILFVALLIVNSVVVFAPSLVFPGIATTIVTFFIGSFADGFTAKMVAGLWKKSPRDIVEVPETIEAEWLDKNL